MMGMPSGLNEALTAYLDHLAFQRKLSPHTLRAYDQDLKHWLVHLQAIGITRLSDLSDRLEATQIRSYVSGMYETHERSSLCRRLSSIRSLLRFFRTQGWVERDVGVLVPSPKAQ